MKCPFDLPVRKTKKHPLFNPYIVDKADEKLLCMCYEENEADYIVHAINSHKELVSELRASDNWLHRLLKSCVILLDDGEVTKRAVEKQSRYNQQALEGECYDA